MSQLGLLRYILFSRPAWRFAIVAVSLAATFLGLAAPYFQKHFIDLLMGINSPSFFPIVETVPPLGLITFAFAFYLCAQAANFLANYLGAREAILLQKKLGEKLFAKTLELRADSLQSRPVGELVSLYATDVPASTVFLEQTLPSGASTLFPLIFAPLALHYLFHLPLAPVLSIIGFVILVNSALAFRQSRFFYQFKMLAADRIGLVNEWIQNMRTLRILGWVPQFEDKIFNKRETETVNRIKMVTNGQVMNSISSSVTFIISLVAIAGLVASRPEITPGELLALLWVLGVFLNRPFRQMPWFFVFGFDGWTSIRRLSSFLSLQNTGRSFPSHLSTSTEPGTAGPSIEVKNLSLSINNKSLLKGIHLQIHEGEFIGLVGEVGSGKSLLLLSLMGETGADFDTYRINGKNMLSVSKQDLCKHFAFVPQEGFVMSASLRDNVALEYDSDRKMEPRILDSLAHASFRLDKENIADGLETEIGERGVNLSGGQKQRVNIARADYFDSPVMLLDDSLSAVDVDTETLLIENLFNGRWKNKTRLLATHRLSVLEKMDRIIFLSQGQLMGIGSFQELLASNSKFKEFIEASHDAH